MLKCHPKDQHMSDEITPELFEYLVGLAAIEFDAAQAEYLRRQLNNQLKSIHELEAIPLTDDVPVSLHGVPYPPQVSPALRRDEWHPDENTVGIQNQAPQLTDGYIQVPDIPHTTL
jgi:aspartyl-tRNA(Asn)/glutamyl-tRNA(Gln) amidotransferase subunit C